MAKISVILTVFNESSTILETLQALKIQTKPPDEVVIVDGGSTDDTYSKLQFQSKSWNKLRVYQQSGNRSVGRNYAIYKSFGNIIAITDAGCIPEPTWLAELSNPFSDKSVQVVSGYYRGHAENAFQKCLIPYVLVMPDAATKTEFYPATRSMAIRRSAWVKSGGFDPNLSHNEDYAFAHHLKYLGYSFTFAPQAIVIWYPRQDLRSAAWMFMRFAIGDIQAGILRPKVKLLAIRYLIFTFVFFLAVEIPALWTLVGVMATLYMLLAIMKNYKYVRSYWAFFWLPVLQITSDISVLFGSIVGFLSKAYGIS